MKQICRLFQMLLFTRTMGPTLAQSIAFHILKFFMYVIFLSMCQFHIGLCSWQTDGQMDRRMENHRGGDCRQTNGQLQRPVLVCIKFTFYDFPSVCLSVTNNSVGSTALHRRAILLAKFGPILLVIYI